MTLPYPDMDFVPFDILTAEELDQIVANIESLSDGSGLEEVSTDIISNPHKFLVYRTGDFNVTGLSTSSKIPFNTEVYDTGGNFDSSTNYRFTAPIAGFYHFNAILKTAVIGANRRMIISIWKNGAIYLDGTDREQSVGYISLQINEDIQLAQNDYIEIYVFHTDGQSISGILAHTRFSGHLISAT